MFLVNSRLGLFTATAASSGGKPLHRQRHTFSRSYGVNLPSSFTRDHSCALGFSPRLPVSVCGTVASHLPRGFSWQHGVTHFTVQRPRRRASELMKRRICLPLPPTRLNHHVQQVAGLSFCVTPSVKRCFGGAGMLTCFPSTTPFGLALGTD